MVKEYYINRYGYRCDMCGKERRIMRNDSVTINAGYDWEDAAERGRIMRVYKNGQPVWKVDMRNARTGEEISLEVTGNTNEEATRKCTALFGYKGDYIWLGTGPLYD